MTSLLRTSLASALLLAFVPMVSTAAELPKARVLMDKHLKAIGGRKALEAKSDGTMRATIDIVEAGIKSEMTMYALNGNRSMRIVFPNIGEFLSGSHGDVVWSQDPMGGPRILDGKERDFQLETFDPKVAARDASLIASATTTGLSESEGRPCYRVEIQWKSGRNYVDCYSVDNGLLLSTEMTGVTAMGEMKTVSHFDDYQTVGNAKAPMTTRIKLTGMTQVMKIASFDLTPPAADTVALPPAIDALVKKAAAAKAGTASAPASVPQAQEGNGVRNDVSH